LTEEELAERRQKRKEAAEKRAKLAEEDHQRQMVRRRQRLEDFWRRGGYSSCNVSLESEEEIENETENDFSIDLGDDDDQNTGTIQFVVGDVTHPQSTGNKDAIIVHCVDDSGQWGHGGLFTAISGRSTQPKSQYEMAAKMRDLSLGDCHIIPVDDVNSRDSGSDLVALVVAQRRGRHNQVSGVKLSALEEGLQRVAQVAKTRKASVHLPRIGHSTPNFNWYGTERVIRKRLASRGIPTFVYYFSSHSRNKVLPISPASAATANDPHDRRDMNEISEFDELVSADLRKEEQGHAVQYLSGLRVYFYGVDDVKKRALESKVVAHGGDVTSTVGPDVTHVVCDNCWPQEIESLDLTAVPVSFLWLEECIKRGNIVSVADYIVVSE
jgi:hypothetical protein